MAGRVIAAVFDVDRTLLPRTSMEQQLVFWLLRRGHLGPLVVVRTALDVARQLGELRRRGYVEYHGYLRGQRAVDVELWAERCLVERIVPRLSREGTARLAEHRRAGHLTVLLSGSILPLVGRLGAHLGADLVVATQLEVVGGYCTGRSLGRHVAGLQKAVVVGELAEQHGIDLAASYCYADHRSDLPMLELFGHPVPTNPDRTLARLARERGWSAQRFH